MPLEKKMKGAAFLPPFLPSFLFPYRSAQSEADSFAVRYLKRHGWDTNSGLGKEGQGQKEFIFTSPWAGRQGLGFNSAHKQKEVRF